MLPFFTEQYGNASSIHSVGAEAKNALEESRTKLASFLGAKPEEIVFTSGGTESNNFALKGIAYANRQKGKHIITSRIEHDSILNPCQWLEKQGFEVTYLPVDNEGFISINDLKNSIRKDTILVSIIHANNEIGTIEPIEEIGTVCREHHISFHTDACQSFTKVPLNIRRQPIDLMTINAHKIYGPKGVGALFIKEGTTISPWQHGGGHERGLRSSTENIPGIIGLTKAATISIEEFERETKRLTQLRDKIITTIEETIETSYLNGPKNNRVCNNVNVGFHGLEGEAVKLLMELDERKIIVSTGSACSSNEGENKPSHVLSAIGLNQVEARGALRITLGRYNTEDEVDYFLSTLPESMRSLRSIFTITKR